MQSAVIHRWWLDGLMLLAGYLPAVPELQSLTEYPWI